LLDHDLNDVKAKHAKVILKNQAWFSAKTRVISVETTCGFD